jgi:hypothetical protein
MTKHLKTTDVKPEQQNEEKITMTAQTSTLSPQQPTPATTVDADADLAALASEARELTDDIRVGDDMRFKKGKWTKTVGDKEIEIGATTTFVADVRSYKRGWIKWVDRKPAAKILGRPVDGFVSPVRDRLGDHDEKRWPRDNRGAPQDPWQENFLIVMRDLGDGRLCTWTTTSWYGSKALGTLLTTYVRQSKSHAGLDPVVLLSTETKTTASYGDVSAPVLTVVDWQPFGEGASPPGMPLSQPQLPAVQEVLPPPPNRRRRLATRWTMRFRGDPTTNNGADFQIGRPPLDRTKDQVRRPLWQQFVEMTPEEVEAEQAADLARMRDGTMTEEEAGERAKAWEKAGEWQQQQANILERIDRLAQATSCPKDVHPVRWLIDKKLLIKTTDGYAFT